MSQVGLLGRRAILLGALGSLSIPGAAASSAAQRGFQSATEAGLTRHGHHYVVAIGIDHYQSWPVLGTAVSDATGFAKLLTSQFGFEYATEPLTEKNATRDNINSLIDDDLRGKLKPDDDLILFFAGHGTTRNDKVGDQTQSMGFLIPVEARASSANEHWSDYLNVEEFLQKVSSLPSSHILVILDSCHSGMALGGKFNRTRAGATRFQEDMLRKVSREVIASAQDDQLAADAGPLSGHSLFTGLMINGLTSGQADNFKQGFITASQLGAYTQHEVGVAAGSKQTPIFGTFDLDARGELIIPLGAGAAASTGPSSNASPTALTPLESNEVARMRNEDPHYWQDDNPLKNFPAARSAGLKLCEKGDGWGCGQAANSYRFGLGGGTDYTRAVELARQGCQAKTDASCVVLGILYQSGQTVLPDTQGAARLYRDACAHGNLRGCADLGNLYLHGQGVQKDAGQAVTLYRKACDGGEMLGCLDLGAVYETGNGEEKNLSQAESLYRKACDGGDTGGCNDLAFMYSSDGVAKDIGRGVTLFRKACDDGDMRACSNLGFIYQMGNGVGKDAVQAVALNRRACDGGDMPACTNLGEMQENGEGVEKDFTRAVTLFRRACDGADMPGCTDLGEMYVKALGVEKDTALGMSLYHKACDGGSQDACTRLKSPQ